MGRKHSISVKETFSTKEEWLKARGIGGSAAATIMGEGKWESIDSLYDKLTHQVEEKPLAPNKRMEEGTNTEASIRTLFAYDFADEYEVKAPPKKGNWLWRRTDKPYITVSPDGILKRKSDGAMCGLEIKNVELRRAEDREAWLSGSLPEQYFWQCLQYMVAIPDMQEVVLYAHLKQFALVGEQWVFDQALDKPFIVRRHDFPKEIIRLEDKQTDFYENFVKKGVRPPLVIKLEEFHKHG